MSQHILLSVNDASGVGAEAALFAKEMEKAGWQAIARVALAFHKSYPAEASPAEVAQSIQQEVGKAAFEADFSRTDYVYSVSSAAPASGHYQL